MQNGPKMMLIEAWMKDMIATACKENVERLGERFEQKLQNLADTFEGLIASKRKANATTTSTDSHCSNAGNFLAHNEPTW
jgi:hypothetical protein